MKSKRAIIAIGGAALLVIVALTVLIIFKPFHKATDIHTVVNEPLSLKEAAAYVHELSNFNAEDEISVALLTGSTMCIVAIDDTAKTATVEFRVPDIEKILRAEMPATPSAEAEAGFDEYFARVNESIAHAGEENLITQTLTCPVITDGADRRISVANTQLLNYHGLLAEILLGFVEGGESAR